MDRWYFGVTLVFARTFAVLSALVLGLALLVRFLRPLAAEPAGYSAVLFFLAVSAATLLEAFRRGLAVAVIGSTSVIGFAVLNYAVVRYGVFWGL